MTNQQTHLKVTGLTKCYGSNTVLSGIDISVAAGEVVCVLGPNGAGKTTLISTILGLVAEDTGEIHVLGERQNGTSRSMALRQQLGVMMQIGNLGANLSVAEQCDLFASYYQNGYSASELINIAGLQEHAKQRFGRLSGGQKQRLLFAMALAGKPKLVFLDEPSLGMDVEARQNLWHQIRTLKQQGVAVILTTHYLEEAEHLADRILVLNNAQIIAQGSPAQLKALTAYKFIHCRSTMSDSQLKALPGVQKLIRQPNKISLQSVSVEQTLKALLTQDSKVKDIEVQPVALEQAFLALTRNTNVQEKVA
jgi:ABC-2 type transport system ATP-binding protein